MVTYSSEAVKLTKPLNAKIVIAIGLFLVSQTAFQNLDIKRSADWRANNWTALKEIRTSDLFGRIVGKGVLVPPGASALERPN